MRVWVAVLVLAVVLVAVLWFTKKKEVKAVSSGGGSPKVSPSVPLGVGEFSSLAGGVEQYLMRTQPTL